MKSYSSLRKFNITDLSQLLLMTVLCIGMIIFSSIPSFADITANDSMRLSKTEGTVTVCNQNSKAVSVVNNLKLLDGYSVETAAASYAWLTLDDTKAVKIDSMSCIEISQSGKKLELRVKSGNILVNVDRHLEADETLNIRTATMVAGIRGTSVVVRVIDADHSQVQLLEGSTEIQAADPVTGQIKTATISSGQTADAYVYDQNKSGDKVDIIVNTVTEEILTPFAAVELSENAVMKERVEANTELNIQKIINESVSKLESEQKAIVSELNTINIQSAVQTVSSAATQAVQTAVSSVQATVVSQTAAQTNVSSVFAAEESSESSSQASSGGDSEGGQASTELIILTMPVTADTLQNSLNRYNNVTLNGGGTFELSGQLTVPAGKTFTVNSGTGFQVASGGDLWIWGHMEVPDGMTNNGSVHNMSSNTLVTSLVNNGTFENKGRIDGTVQNAGTFTSDTYNGESTGLVTGNFLNTGSLTINDGKFQGNVILNTDSASSSVPGFTMNGGSVEGTLNISMPDSPVTIKGGSVGELKLNKDRLNALNIYDGAEVKLSAEQVEDFSEHISYFDDTQTEYFLDSCPFWGFEGTFDGGYLDFSAVPHTLMWVVDSAGNGNEVDSVLLNRDYVSDGGTVSAYSSPVSSDEDKTTDSGTSDRYLTIDLNGVDLSMGGSWTMDQGMHVTNSYDPNNIKPVFTVFQLSLDADSDFDHATLNNTDVTAFSITRGHALTLTKCTYSFTSHGISSLSLPEDSSIIFNTSTWDTKDVTPGKSLIGSINESGGKFVMNNDSCVNGDGALLSGLNLEIDKNSSVVGTLYVQNGGTVTSEGSIAVLSNAGTANIESGGTIINKSTNRGTVYVRSGGTVGDIDNYGNIELYSGSKTGTITNIGDGKVTHKDSDDNVTNALTSVENTADTKHTAAEEASSENKETEAASSSDNSDLKETVEAVSVSGYGEISETATGKISTAGAPGTASSGNAPGAVEKADAETAEKSSETKTDGTTGNTEGENK